MEDDTNSYIYGNDTAPIAQIDKTTDEIHYLHGDERGSITLATDNTGNSVLTRVYDAYGNHTDETVINPSNGPPNDFTTNFAYAGEYQDKDSGLYNLRARWYEPSTGNFLNQDPALLLTGEAYSYASGNPLSFTDPLGLYSMGITPSDNKWGNMAAGFVDGLIGYPVVHKISNTIKPGSVSNCGPGYKYANIAGNIAGLASPGGPALKGTALVVGIGIKATTKTKKVREFAEQGLTTAQARQNVLDAAKKAPQNGSSYIYLRTDPRDGKIYVGRSESEISFERRKQAHNRNLRKEAGDNTLKYDFKTIAKPNGYNETKRTEEFLIRAGGGPKTTENPHAVLQNKIYASSDEKYQALGGDFI